MREVVQTAQFKKDLKRIARSGRYRIEELLDAVDRLSRDERLSVSHRDHALTGDLATHRECHIRPDWLLVRTRSHSELFDWNQLWTEFGRIAVDPMHLLYSRYKAT